MTFICVDFFRARARSVAVSFVRTQSLALVAGSCILLAAISQPAFSAPINYGNFSGNTVDYLEVTEDSNSGDTLPLFGAPTVTGDSIDFNPVGFDANSANGGADITDGQLKFIVVAKDPIGTDFGISSISFNEAGDTTIAGLGTDATTTAVFANVFINILEVDGIGINSISVPAALTFTPSGGTFGLGTDGGGGPLFSSAWSGSLSVDLNAILTSNSVPFTVGATKITVNLDNTLVATSQAGTQSLIAKKDFGGLSVTVNMPDPGEIPEPTSLALAGLGLFALTLGRRQLNS